MVRIQRADYEDAKQEVALASILGLKRAVNIAVFDSILPSFVFTAGSIDSGGNGSRIQARTQIENEVDNKNRLTALHNRLHKSWVKRFADCFCMTISNVKVSERRWGRLLSDARKLASLAEYLHMRHRVKEHLGNARWILSLKASSIRKLKGE